MAELNVSSGKKNGRRSSPKLSPRVDLTAMVDLAFLLITFFIMTTSLAKPHAMDVTMPVPGPSEPVPESRTMTICLGKNNRVLYYVGLAEKPLSAPKLVDYSKTGLREAIIYTGKNILKTTGKTMIVIVKPDVHSQYADLVAALDELHITNVPSYAIADISPEDVDLLKQQNAY